ncbi:MAG: MMPL family transporter [Acidimicrobiales bacterium]
MGVGVSLTVLVTMLTSITLLPALLGITHRSLEVTRWRGLIAAAGVSLALVGAGVGSAAVTLGGVGLAIGTVVASSVVAPLRRRVPRRAPRPVVDTWPHRWSRVVQRRPSFWLLVSCGLLLVLATPVLGMRLAWPDEGYFPGETSTRQAYELLADGFGGGFNGPFMVTVESPPGADPTVVDALRGALAATPGVAEVSTPIPDDPSAPAAHLMTVIPTTPPQDQATTDLVRSLRSEVIPSVVEGTGADVHITGTAPINIDVTEYLGDRMPVFFAAVLGASFLALMIVFRSILVALKAVAMNVLSIAAAYGVVVAVFQWGWGASLLGIEGGPINPFVPLMLFAIVFGLSMDYEVFLLSRIREEYDRTGDPVASVADGVASTARVITAAAAIMVVVFGSFAFEDVREVKLFGLGLALAVAIDATLVRMVLVPSAMALLGHRNWWIPGWLDRVLPRLSVEGTPAPPAPVSASAE